MSDPEHLLGLIAGDDAWARHRALEGLRAEAVDERTVDALRGALAGDDAARRSAARMALAALASPDAPAEEMALDALSSALHDPDPGLRTLAASALGETGNPEAGTLLVDALDDAEPNVIAAAADGLGELGHPPALQPLAALTGSSDFWLRAAAVVALGRLRDERALPFLSEVAREPGLERPLVEAIARIGHPDGLDTLRVLHETLPDEALLAAGGILCAHPDREAPTWIVDGARAREHVLRQRLVEVDELAAARLLGVAGTDEAIDTLLELIGPPRRSEAAILGLLAAPGDRRHDAILDRLPGADRDETVALLSVLPPASRADRIRPLVPLLADPDEEVRAAAAEALARAPAETALPLLVAELDRRGVAAEVVRALGSLGPVACAALTPLLRDPSASVRSAAALALARCAGSDIVEPIRRAYGGEGDPGVRQALLHALGRAGGGSSVDLLEGVARSEDDSERIAAIEALGLTASPAAVPALEAALHRSTADTQAALRALANIGGESAAAAIAGCLDSGDLETRRAAARAVARTPAFHGAGVGDRLAGDDDAGVRLFAVRLLAAGGGWPRVERLAESDPDPEVREEARRYLPDR
ncbi:MAG TPA: HEAT repeat domain-containing protein [Longimicrobiales bacterium]|nr:HEAT repeat domain-containing protein [Longimicrobiales bacterium]